MRLVFLSAALIFAGAAAAAAPGSGMTDTALYEGTPYAQTGVPSGAPERCRETCRGDSRCAAWSFEKRSSGGTTRCLLFDRPGALVYDPGFISGEVMRSAKGSDADPPGAAPSAWPGKPGAAEDPAAGVDFWDRFAMQPGEEAAGAPYASWSYEAKGDGGLTRCAKACAASGACAAFVVRSDPSIAPPPVVICDLKERAGTLLRNPDATTGVKRR